MDGFEVSLVLCNVWVGFWVQMNLLLFHGHCDRIPNGRCSISCLEITASVFYIYRFFLHCWSVVDFALEDWLERRFDTLWDTELS